VAFAQKRSERVNDRHTDIQRLNGFFKALAIVVQEERLVHHMEAVTVGSHRNQPGIDGFFNIIFFIQIQNIAAVGGFIACNKRHMFPVG
jgi:hypothetical protein